MLYFGVANKNYEYNARYYKCFTLHYKPRLLFWNIKPKCHGLTLRMI